MKPVDNNTTPVVEYDGSPRRLNMHCRFCRHNWSTWTRRGLRAKCPNCGRIVEGPEKVRQLIEGTGARRSQAATVTPIRIATVDVTPPAAAKKPQPKKPATTTTKTPHAAAPPPAAQQSGGGLMGLVGKALGY